MEIRGTNPSTQRLACVTLDFETDYGHRTDGAFRILRQSGDLERLASSFERLEVPVSAFVRTDLFAHHAGSLEWLRRLAVDFHGHSHSHVRQGFDSAYEIPRCQEVFTETFGRPALGYRAPYGLLYEGDQDRLLDQGFRFSSSVFPVFFPGRYNHRGMPATPFAWPNGLVELPLASVRYLRITAALSFVKLLGLPATRLLYGICGLPEVIVFNTHLHDFIVAEESFRSLPKHLRWAWGVHKHEGLSYFEVVITWLRERGYNFVSMTDLYRQVSGQIGPGRGVTAG